MLTELRPTGPETAPVTIAATPEPRWLRTIALGTAAAVAAFGATGLALAVAGVYRPMLVFPLGAVVWIALLVVARPILRAPGASAPADHAAGALALLFVGAMGGWNALHASQHVFVNRDGGVYANAGRWIAAHGNLRVVADVGPFTRERGLSFASIGIYEDKHHVLSFQFAHLLPTLLAELRQIGGDRLMFAAPASLSSVALLALFVAACRFVRNPYIALAAVISFGFLLSEVSFSRDTVSEIPSQVLLFTALWIFVDRRALRSPRTAFVAGVFLGLLQAAHVDALLLLVGVPFLFAFAWLGARPEDRRSIALSSAACAAGMAPGIVLGFTDVALRSTHYLQSLRPEVTHLVFAALGAVVVALGIAFAGSRASARGMRVPRDVERYVAPAIVIVGFATWLLRPGVQRVRIPANPVVSLHQAADGIAIDPTRAYWERSLTWMSWYLGPLSVAAAIIATALLARALLRRRALGALGAVALLGPASSLYLWHANAFPDQVWVTRRYLDSAFPLLTLLAFGMVATLVWWKPTRLPRSVPIALAIALGAIVVVHPIRVLLPVRNMTEQRGNLAVVTDACRIVGPRAAIVVLRGPVDGADRTAPQALRGWCDADVAVMSARPADTDALTRLASDWSRRGTALWVVADQAATVTAAFPGVTTVSTRVATNRTMLRSTIVRRPSEYETEQYSLTLARVPAS